MSFSTLMIVERVWLSAVFFVQRRQNQLDNNPEDGTKWTGSCWHTPQLFLCPILLGRAGTRQGMYTTSWSMNSNFSLRQGIWDLDVLPLRALKTVWSPKCQDNYSIFFDFDLILLWFGHIEMIWKSLKQKPLGPTKIPQGTLNVTFLLVTCLTECPENWMLGCAFSWLHGLQIPAGYPAVPIELELPELDGKTPKMPLRLGQFFFKCFMSIQRENLGVIHAESYVTLIRLGKHWHTGFL